MGHLRAAFTGTHSGTLTFNAISKRLEDADVFWIMPGAGFRIDHLTSTGTDTSNILDLSNVRRYYDKEVLAELESFSEVTASYIIMSDRLLKDRADAYEYLCCVYSAIKKFLLDNGIRVVFSEASWAYELVTCAAARAVGAEFLVPHTIRYPQGRFAFFRGIFQNEIAETGNSCGLRRLPFIERGQQTSAMPSIFNRKNVTGFFKHIRRFIGGSDSDETSYSPLWLVKDRIRKAVNSRLSGFDRMPQTVEGDYVYYPLHCQPEASIDVLGGFYSDQTALIKNIVRSLPAGLKLAVKEHPAGIGCRPTSFFRSLASLPNLVWVSPFAGDIELIKRAKAVISVSGTACYEAAMLGVGSVVFTDVFYGELSNVVRCRSLEDLGKDIESAMNSRYDLHAAGEFFAWLLSCSYEGCVEPAEINPEALKEENARVTAQAFMDVLRYYSSSRPVCMAASISSR